MLARAMAYNGADGTTREAMARALEVEGMSLDDVDRAFGDVKSALVQQIRKYNSESRIHFGPETGSLRPAFIKRSTDNTKLT